MSLRKPEQSTQIEYVGHAATKSDLYCGSKLTWHGHGDVCEVKDPDIARKLLEHPDIWRVFDPNRVEVADIAQALPGAVADSQAAPIDPATLKAADSVDVARVAAIVGQEDPIDALLDSLPGIVAQLRADPALAAAVAADYGLVLAEPAAPPAAAAPTPPVVGSVDERDLLVEKLRGEASQLSIEWRSNWGVPALTRAINDKRSEAAAAAREAGQADA